MWPLINGHCREQNNGFWPVELLTVACRELHFKAHSSSGSLALRWHSTQDLRDTKTTFKKNPVDPTESLSLEEALFCVLCVFPIDALAHFQSHSLCIALSQSQMTRRVTGPLVGRKCNTAELPHAFWCSYMPSGNEWTRRLIKTHRAAPPHTHKHNSHEENCSESRKPEVHLKQAKQIFF